MVNEGDTLTIHCRLDAVITSSPDGAAFDKVPQIGVDFAWFADGQEKETSKEAVQCILTHRYDLEELQLHSSQFNVTCNDKLVLSKAISGHDEGLFYCNATLRLDDVPKVHYDGQVVIRIEDSRLSTKAQHSGEFSQTRRTLPMFIRTLLRLYG